MAKFNQQMVKFSQHISESEGEGKDDSNLNSESGMEGVSTEEPVDDSQPPFSGNKSYSSLEQIQ